MGTPTLVQGQDAPTNTRILLDARRTRLYWQSSGPTRTSHRRQGSRPPGSEARGFLRSKGLGVRGISTKVQDWLIQTLTEKLHANKKGIRNLFLWAWDYLCSHNNQLICDFTHSQGVIDRGEVLARWCWLRQDSPACPCIPFHLYSQAVLRNALTTALAWHAWVCQYLIQIKNKNNLP